MKAIICTKYGPPKVLQLKEVEKPTPKDNEVLIKVHATTVTMGDCELRNLSFGFFLRLFIRLGFGFRGPRKGIIGQELAGEIESVGKDVTLHEIGDRVFAPTDFSLGAYAEYKCLNEKGALAIIPTNMSYEEAATVPLGGLNALHFFRKGKIQVGEKVLINGAGGSIGTYAIQIAKHYGAEVIAVDSTEKLDMLISIGADKVIDYTQEDFTKTGETYDVIFDIVGKSSYSPCIKSLNKKGRYLLANPKFSQMFRGLWTSKRSDKKVISGTVAYKTHDLIFLKELIEDEKITSVIDRRYPLEQTAEAHIYVETGEKKGNVVITVVDANETS